VSHDPSETFLIIITLENSFAASYFCGIRDTFFSQDSLINKCLHLFKICDYGILKYFIPFNLHQFTGTEPTPPQSFIMSTHTSTITNIDYRSITE